MDERYEAFLMADPVFYDVAHSGDASEPPASEPPAGERPTGSTAPAAPGFRVTRRPVPDGWTKSYQDDWLVLHTDARSLPEQGWKIHASACCDSGVDNADRVLDAVWDYCVPRGIDFKFLRSPAALLARVSKYAPRGYSGKLVTIYPADLAACETILRELGEILEGEPSSYILSDLRWGSGPLYVRYGAFRNRYTVDDTGQVVAAIAGPDGELVADRRGPAFATPPWVDLPDFLAPHLAARNAIRVDQTPYTVERVLHFSNGGGVYLGRDSRTGESVVLKEGRPHSGLDARRDDAVRRLEREYETLRELAGIPGIPRAHDLFWLGEHRFLAMEHIQGRVLSQEIVRRYPLIDPSAGPAEYGAFTDWATGVYRQVERTVTAMHERGVVYGDLHLFNIMVRDDGTVALLDFEVAAPVAEATQPGLGNQGFAPPRGATGTDIDLYALACLRLALFLPMTQLLWLHRPKAHHFVEIIDSHFPVSREFLAPAVAVIAPGEHPDAVVRTEPDPDRWPELRDAMVRAILTSATPERDDRLFPGDPEQFSVGGLGLANGAAGVLYALSVTGAARQPQLEEWLLSRATNPPSGTRPGLYDGLHGVAHVLERLGHRQAALDTVDICLRENWETLGPDLGGGLAGVGLNLLHLADRTGEPALRAAAHRAAALVADRISRDPEYTVEGGPAGAEPAAGVEPLISGREHGYAGLIRGDAGTALFLLRAFDDTGDTGYLDLAARALRRDLRRCRWRDNGALEVNEGWRTMPYLGVGSAGIGLVLDEYLARRPDEQFAEASRGVLAAAQAAMYILPGLFSGRAGILHYLAGRSPDPVTDPLVARQIRNLAWHALPYGHAQPYGRAAGHAGPDRTGSGEDRPAGPSGLAFPGTGLLRLSMDLATGTAGVLLAVGAALCPTRVHAPLIGPTAASTAAPAGPAAVRATQTPAPTGAGS